jgi:hypothetical protein
VIRAALDHLVIGAATLDEGVAWCEATLGITPGPGGKHALMSTHNRLFSIGSERFPKAYAEIIAIDPQAPPPGRARWFDLDAAGLQRALADGPALIHWVARTASLDETLSQLKHAGLDAGERLSAERETAHGLLRWQIGVRPDGRRLCSGAFPTWIAWGERHPADTMPASGVVLASMSIAGLPPEAMDLVAWPAGVTAAAAPSAPAVRVLLQTPHGSVELCARA